MFCSKCGQPIQQQAFCSSCGAPTGLNLQAAPGYAIPTHPSLLTSRVQRHLQTTGILWIAYAGYMMLHWILARTVMHAFFQARPDFMGIPLIVQHMPQNAPWGGPFFGSWFITFITVILISRAIFAVAVGAALLTRQPWGRIFAVVIAILTLIHPVTGTVLAIYTLWVLCGQRARYEYNELVAERPRH